MLDPLARAGGLDGALGRARNGNYVMARRIRCGSPMEEITSPDVDQDTIDRCRELLGEDGVDLPDDDIDRVRQHADIVARGNTKPPRP
jgi:hypothetical protein